MPSMSERTRATRSSIQLPIAGLAVALLLAATAQAQERRMGVSQMPDTVFSQPVDALVPELAGATPTNENGRVGSELVFWGYRLEDGRQTYLFACAMSETVNCDERVQLICPNRTDVIRSSTVDGTVTRMQCRNISVSAPGDLRPGCTDKPAAAPLAVGLVSCG